MTKLKTIATLGKIGDEIHGAILSEDVVDNFCRRVEDMAPIFGECTPPDDFIRTPEDHIRRFTTIDIKRVSHRVNRAYIEDGNLMAEFVPVREELIPEQHNFAIRACKSERTGIMTIITIDLTV